MKPEQNPTKTDLDISDLSARTIDKIIIHGPTAIIDNLTRQQIVINRIWCKALVRYLTRDLKSTEDEELVLILKKLSNFTQCLRSEVSYSKYGHGSRANVMYKRMILRISQANGGLGWNEPYRILESIINDPELSKQVIGSTDFKF